MANHANAVATGLVTLLIPSAFMARGAEPGHLTWRSKDGLIQRRVLPNGDYCQIREWAGEEHVGRRIVYLVTERGLDADGAKALISQLVKAHCGKREAPHFLLKLAAFDPRRQKSQEHWQIEVDEPGYSEFFISVDWISESVAIQIKYWT